MPRPPTPDDLQHVLAGLVQGEYVLRLHGQWQAADACRTAHQILTRHADHTTKE